MTDTWIPMEECKTRRLYRIRSRNLRVGVYDGKEGFLGIRTKFGSRYVFTEYHWDQGPPHGTVKPQEDLGVDLPEEILLEEYVGTVDKSTRRPVGFDRTKATPEEGGNAVGYKGWYFTDTGEYSQGIHGVLVGNDKLFAWLEEHDGTTSQS